MTKRLLMVVLAMIFAGSCAQNTQSLVILQNQVPSSSGGVCSVPAAPTTEYRGQGTLDLKVYRTFPGLGLPGYFLYPVVQNNLSDSVMGTPSGAPAASFNIELTRADVTVVDGRTSRTIGQPFSVPWFKLLAAGATASMAVEAIPRSTVDRYLAGELTLPANDWLMAKVTFVGNRDGAEIKSNEMQFAVKVCDGCLLQDMGSCYTFTGTGTINECNMAQDEPAICCELNGSLICPAQSATQQDAGTPDAGTPDAGP
ncbi:MAG TPA: hypothetical protein VGQ83_08095 [Polyangia bacterium]